MAMIEGKTYLEVLSPIACDRHLRTETIGRVAVPVGDHSEIFPVNYAVDDRGDILFRTDPGTKLAAIGTTPTISFEIDGIDERNQLGWSVLAVGPAHWLASPELLAKASALSLQPWAAGEKAHVVRLSPTKLSGRRIYRPRTSDRHAPEE